MDILNIIFYIKFIDIHKNINETKRAGTKSGTFSFIRELRGKATRRCQDRGIS